MRLPTLFLLCSCLFGPLVFAGTESGCIRPMVIGASPLGTNMTVSPSGDVGGLYPEFLRLVADAGECRFTYTVLPRARALKMLEAGDGIDIIIPAVRTESRDRAAEFVPLIRTRVMLIYHRRISGDPLKQLADGNLRLNVVRGFDYGPEYQALLARYSALGRMEDVTDPEMLVKKILANRADATILVPQNIAQAVKNLGAEDELHSVEVPNLPTQWSGAYLSKLRLSSSEISAAKANIEAMRDNGSFWKLFKQFTPAWALHANTPYTASTPR